MSVLRYKILHLNRDMSQVAKCTSELFITEHILYTEYMIVGWL